MANNPQLNKIKAELRAENPQLTKDEITEMAIKVYNERFPNNPITQEESNLGVADQPTDETAASTSTPNPQAGDTAKEEVVTMTKAQLDAMFKQMESNVTARIEKKFQGVAVEKTESILDDYLEEPVTFFAYSNQHILNGYTLRGKEMLPPNGKIKFAHTAKYRKSILGTGEMRDVQLCAAIIRSKKEVEYIRKSPDFGILIFENINGGDDIKMYMADFLSKAQKVVAPMNHHSVIQRAQQVGIKVSDNIDDVRRALIFKMAEEDMASYKRRYEATASAGTDVTDSVINSAYQAK